MYDTYVLCSCCVLVVDSLKAMEFAGLIVYEVLGHTRITYGCKFNDLNKFYKRKFSKNPITLVINHGIR